VSVTIFKRSFNMKAFNNLQKKSLLLCSLLTALGGRTPLKNCFSWSFFAKKTPSSKLAWMPILSIALCSLIISSCENPWMRDILGKKKKPDTSSVIAANWNNEDFDGNAPDRTFTVSSLEQWNAAIAAIKTGGNNKNYVITIPDGVTIDVPGDTDNTFDPATNIKVSLRGSGTLSLDETSTGSIIRAGANQKVILRDLTLKGNSGNNTQLVYMSGTNGAFVMHSGTITGNNGGGVRVGTNVTFDMYGGTISNNTAGNGGGVYVNNGTFTMHNGTISGNTGSIGGGVCVASGTFRLVAGTIYGTDATPDTLRNTATSSGAALFVGTGAGTAERGTFNGETWIPSVALETTNNTIR
jgi:hypothetical protein